MISEEKFKDLLSNLDNSIENKKNEPDIGVEWCVKEYCKIKFNKELPIVWVKEGTTPITEFYPSELNLSWIVTYIDFYQGELYRFKNKDVDDDLTEIYGACVYLSHILTHVKGINIVDGVFYLLKNDYEMVQYKVDKNIFLPTT